MLLQHAGTVISIFQSIIVCLDNTDVNLLRGGPSCLDNLAAKLSYNPQYIKPPVTLQYSSGRLQQG